MYPAIGGDKMRHPSRAGVNECLDPAGRFSISGMNGRQRATPPRATVRRRSASSQARATVVSSTSVPVRYELPDHNLGLDVMRVTSLSVPAVTVNMVCLSGLDAVALADHLIG